MERGQLCLISTVGLWEDSGNSTGLISRLGAQRKPSVTLSPARLTCAHRCMAPEEQGELIKNHLCHLPAQRVFLLQGSSCVPGHLQ